MSSNPRTTVSGSCHCGSTKFLVTLDLPPSPPLPNPQPGTQRLYRCNCTVCHKLALLHIRPADPHADFQLLSPLDLAELGDYTCNSGRTHWYFCRTCGVRCLSFWGEGERVKTGVKLPGRWEEGEKVGEERELWRPGPAMRPEVEREKGERNGYLSVNGHAVDAGQEGFDPRAWVTERCFEYLDLLGDPTPKERMRTDQPFEGGCW